MSKRDWTEGLPELFEGYTEAAPEGLWEAVEAGSGASAGRRRIAGWWYGGALLAAAAVVALVILFRPAADPSVVNVGAGELVAQEGIGADTVSPAEEGGTEEGIGSETHATLGIVRGGTMSEANGGVERSETVSDPIPSSITGGYGSKRDSVLPDDLTPSSTVETAAETQGDSTVEQESVETTAKTGEIPPEEPNSWKQTTVPLERHQPAPSRERQTRQRQPIRIMAGVSGGLMAQNVSQSGQQAAQVASMIGSAPVIQTKSITGGSTTLNPSMFGRNKPSTTECNHRQSARLAAGIKVNFLPHWGVETGITATTLESNWETTTGNSVQTTEQMMHYLGIPLYLHFNALEWRGMSLYLAAGPMYEFTDETSEICSTRLNGKLISSAADQSLQKDHRWSVNAAAGLQLEFMENNAIYIQPGFSYHFKHKNVDGLDVQNYYTAKPAAFNLTIGYRLILF